MPESSSSQTNTSISSVPEQHSVPRTAVLSAAAGATPSLRASGLIASVPALLLLGLGFMLGHDRVDQPITAALTAPANQALNRALETATALPISQTMIVDSTQSSGHVLLRGALQPVIRATGQAPLSGQVARVMVRSGQNVNVGDRVIQLSTGSTTRAPVGAERAQSAAEAAQIAAARQQDALQNRMQKAQARLREAQLRVEAAQRGVDRARELVATLRRSDSSNSVNSNNEEIETRTTAPSPAARAADKARHDAEVAGREAERAATRAAAARRTLEAAEADAKQKKQKQQDAEAQVDKVEEQFEAKTAKGSDVEAARTAAKDARAAASEADKKVTAAREEAEKLSATSQSLGARAKQLADTAQKQTQKVPVAERATGANRPQAVRSTSDGRKRGNSRNDTTIEQAARIVATAITESDKAVKAADLIKRQVDTYEHQARVTQEKIDASSKRLDAAQERVMENTIQANLSSVRAPATGTVVWVAEIASEVSAGDKLITIAHPNMLEVRLRDYSGAWQQLKPGATLPAIIGSGKAVRGGPDMARLEPGDTQIRPVVRRTSLTPGTSGTFATTVRLRSITPPAHPGAPAVLRAVVYNPSQPGEQAESAERQLQSGLPIVCSAIKPGARVAMNIPVAAIRPNTQGTPTVAVLSPIPTATTGDTVVSTDELYRIEWREVKLGKGDGMQQEVESGLQPGDRIALRPADLYNIMLSRGPQATIRLTTT